LGFLSFFLAFDFSLRTYISLYDDRFDVGCVWAADFEWSFFIGQAWPVGSNELHMGSRDA
jgi:hypothetical protein